MPAPFTGLIAIGQCRLSHRNPGKFNHLAPFFGLVGDEPAEFGRAHRFWDAADLGQAGDQFRIRQRFADGLVEDVDDFRGGPLGAEMP